MPISAASTSRSRTHGSIQILPLVVLPGIVVALSGRLPAWVFMWALAFSVFAVLKWITWWQARNSVPHDAKRSFAYLFAWPGMDARSFLDSRAVALKPLGDEWFWAGFKTIIGIVLLWVVARWIPSDEPLFRGWVGLFGLILLLHFGSFHLISLFWRSFGVAADPIMARPIKSRTLSEFWGKRWNLGFRQLAHDLVFRPLRRPMGVALAGFFVFLVSGLIHDLVISFPARGGYGLPTAYFLVQGLGVTLERSRTGSRLGLQGGVRGWCFMAIITAGPAFWLFHPPFVVRVILPFMHAIRTL